MAIEEQLRLIIQYCLKFLKVRTNIGTMHKIYPYYYNNQMDGFGIYIKNRNSFWVSLKKQKTILRTTNDGRWVDYVIEQDRIATFNEYVLLSTVPSKDASADEKFNFSLLDYSSDELNLLHYFRDNPLPPEIYRIVLNYNELPEVIKAFEMYFDDIEKTTS